ncbi:MAG: aminopeptidase [Acidobacteria bacterium]|nr:MAG: aminopeptidase [Acidobacteriota bacterium]PYU49625.1 MAG: aminopeptidase [Acidobacteriota bacterium]PYU73560.1 MAG: aminopeptidase [Acidobacteriota bacterium]
MRFASPQKELMPGARNAVETCLGMRPGEHVALIADEASRAVAASIAAALDERRARYTGLLLEELGPRPMKAAPAGVLDELETADVGVLCMTPQPGELAARMAIVRVVERRQIRYAHMVGVTPEIMQQGMRADYRLVDQLSEKLRARMLGAETLTVKTEAGTKIAAHFDRGLDWVKTSGLISPRYWSNLPAGEVFTTPATVDGTFVCDATAGDHFNGKYGDLQATPLMLEIQGARLIGVTCARKDLEQEFWDYCHTDENSDRVGELAFGTNLGLSAMIGILLQDEKFPGVHIAFGDPYGSQTHANWKSMTHVDVLTRNCDVWIDDDQVIEKGHYQLEHLGLR